MKAGLFCKSFRGDFEPLSHLLTSFAKHNPEALRLTLSLPAGDLAEFRSRFGPAVPNVDVIADESYVVENLSIYPGWFAQQICKLSSWRTMDCDHYLVVDSDCYVIRDLRASDFTPSPAKRYIAFGSSLRTVLSEKNTDLQRYIAGTIDARDVALPEEPGSAVDRLPEYLAYRKRELSDIKPLQQSDIAFKVFGRDRWLYFQPGQVFSRQLVRSLCDYFSLHALTPGDAIRICPWEYNWYGEFAAARNFFDTEFKISPFVHVQANADVDFARAQGITTGQLAANFFIVAMAARHVAALWL